MSVLELGWHFLRCSACRYSDSVRSATWSRAPTSRFAASPPALQGGLELSVAGVGGLAQEAVRAGHVLADLGGLLGRHAATGDEEDKAKGHNQEQEGAEQRKPGRERPLAAFSRAARGVFLGRPEGLERRVFGAGL